MTVPASAREHVAAVIAALKASTLSTFDGEGPSVTTRPASGWVVVYADAGSLDGTLGDRFRGLLVEFQVTAVGKTPEQARWAADKARTVLLGDPPAVTGRKVFPLWQVGQPPPLTRDDSIQPPVFYQPVSYQMRSTIT